MIIVLFLWVVYPLKNPSNAHLLVQNLAFPSRVYSLANNKMTQKM